MDVKAIYNYHLALNKNNKNSALRKAMDEITDCVNKSDVNDEFMKDYHNAKRHMVILNVISPGIVFGLSTGAIISMLNLNIKITNIPAYVLYLLYVLFILIVGATIFYFLTVGIYGRRVKCVLYPHLVRVMEMKIDKQYESVDNNKHAIVVKIKKIKYKRKNYSIH